ncbi:peptidase domain-containing ABC transporter [Prevotella sp. 20925_1_30]|jgi:ABC transporter, ATP-binding protein|uniref:peptidase domain-containing ABC transporter n=1 Tax=Prevotella TaxID=838 RepID=UPI00352F49DD
MNFPNYRQLDGMDCGPTCLKIIAQYYGRNYSLQMLRDKCHINREGVSLLGISDASEIIGLKPTGVIIEWNELKEHAPLPCIVHWNQQHFIVVYKIKKKKVYVSDPEAGLLVYREEQFIKSWDQSNGKDSPRGIALILEPTPAFYTEKGDEDKRTNFYQLLAYLKPYKNYLVQLTIAMLTASILSLILPFLSQSVVDKGIGTNNLSFVVMMLIAQVALVLGQMANNLIRSWLMLHMTSRISISLISNFLSKLMRLPISFFDSRKLGDIMQRIGDFGRIQSFLTESMLNMVMAIVTFIIYGCVIGGYNIKILGVFLFGSLLYVLWILVFMKRRRKLDYMRFQEASNNQSSIVQLITGMQDIKLNNCEKQKRWEWERIQARLFHVSVKGLLLGQTQDVGGTFIDQIKNVVISFIAARSVIDGSMTLGMMTALQYIIGQLNAPLSQFIQFVQSTQDAKISLERLGEVQEKEDEEPVDKNFILEVPNDVEIIFKDVTYQYDGPHSPKALKNVSLTIPSNKVTAIVGTSGSGKSTIVKMMLGFYQPVKGEILLCGKNLSLYSPSAWRKTCGSVMQDGYIFSDTIANNIGVSDERPNMEKINYAAEIANINDFIESLPLGYNTKIGSDGMGLSSGQKQRILIARAAYKNAKMLFFDEATNSLDANNERTIMERLKKMFYNKTVVVVAHRLSTVKNADNIIVMAHGSIVEQGKHSELIAKQGYYYKLVKNQLELDN